MLRPVLALGVLAVGATAVRAADRLFFSGNPVRGYAEFTVSTSRGGIDLGRCDAGLALAGNPASPCSAFSRYVLGGYLEVQPVGRKVGGIPLDRLFVFAEPAAYFGRNLPRWRYSASAEPAMWERVIGLGIELPRNLELRVLRHENFWFGRYRDDLGDPDLGPNGPYGLYAAVSLRWSFGGWGRRRQMGKSLRGFAEFEVNPSHAERDMGRCTSYAGVFGGADAPCTAFSRYTASGNLQFRPFGGTVGGVPVDRLFLLTQPRMFFGSNVPQYRYSASMSPILLEWSAGAGVRLSEAFELSFRRHGNQWLGRHRGNLGQADLGKAGPFGRYSAVTLRWYFGGWNRR